MELKKTDSLVNRIAKTARKGVSLAAFGVAVALTGLTVPAAQADNVQTGSKEVNNNSGQKFNILAFTDGLRRDKYAVWDYTTNRPTWYSMTGSVNGGKGESGRHTTKQEWCRVRYLYGDDVRIPECWGSFMYSSHLITGLDGYHYELWFSPSSLSYYKIRNQEKDIWYAHDGSNHNPAKPTTKKDWCYVIIIHGKDMLKIPNECQETLSDLMRFSAGKSDGVKAAEVMGDLKDVLNLGTEVGGNYYDIITDSNTTLKGLGKQVGVGMAVGYGTDAVKQAFGWTAKDADAGAIAAEILTTSAVNTGLTSAISMAMSTAGAGGFNPVSVGVGFLVGAGVAGGQALYQASEDTGIQLYPNYGAHPRYNRDLNGIADHNVAPRPLPGNVTHTGFLKSKISGKCIDVQGSPGKDNGSRLQIWDCETGSNTTDQKFVLTSDGFLKSQVSNRCVDVEGSPGMNNGAKLQLWDCETNNSNTDQKWQLTSAGLLKNLKSGKCVDVVGSPGRYNGTFLQLWDCENPNSNTDQTWTSVKP